MESVLLLSVAMAQILSADAAVPGRLEDGCLKVSCNCTTAPICRMAQLCAGLYCPLEARCLTCLPKDFDSVCTRNGYLYAVMVDDGNQPSGIVERKCLLHQGNTEPNCPSGSICVADDRGFGTCCYGRPKPDPLEEPVSSKKKPKTCPQVSNKCDRCQRDRDVCKEFTIFCLIPPCPDPTYKCVPINRQGECPPPSRVCERRFHRCFYDYECSGTLKCCPDDCQIRSCVPSVPVSEVGCLYSN
ncbi:unnamed protein product [Lymnaea stagnalis]|uniref:WAP domain-containing protein n=1 Tax=Lymnaea stagnalis TaxID=6523 RepID=A0AAV2IFQ3_LYMST